MQDGAIILEQYIEISLTPAFEPSKTDSIKINTGASSVNFTGGQPGAQRYWRLTERVQFTNGLIETKATTGALFKLVSK